MNTVELESELREKARALGSAEVIPVTGTMEWKAANALADARLETRRLQDDIHALRYPPVRHWAREIGGGMKICGRCNANLAGNWSLDPCGQQDPQRGVVLPNHDLATLRSKINNLSRTCSDQNEQGSVSVEAVLDILDSFFDTQESSPETCDHGFGKVTARVFGRYCKKCGDFKADRQQPTRHPETGVHCTYVNPETEEFCGLHVTEHFQKDHRFVSDECQRDILGDHVWSQSGDGGDAPCKKCHKRNPEFFPQDWN